MMSINTENGELLAAFMQLGLATQNYVKAHDVASQAAANLTRATQERDKARAVIVKAAKRFLAGASPGDAVFEMRLADVFAFLSSSLRFRDVDAEFDRTQTINENVTSRAEVQP